MSRSRTPSVANVVGGSASSGPRASGNTSPIIFGHNVADRLVCMLLAMPATQLIFTPEQAEGVAESLMEFARLARGEEQPPKVTTAWRGLSKRL